MTMIVTDNGGTIHRSEIRPVARFDAHSACVRDRDLRGKCVLFDLHGYWWSVPMELTLLEIADAIAGELERLDLRPLPYHLGDIYRPKVA